jgi:hypothetical protein
VARGEDVTGWINTVTERRWINELRYQVRRSHHRLDAPVAPSSSSTLGDLAEFAGCGSKDIEGNTITQIIGRQRARLDREGDVPSVVTRLRRARQSA